MYLTLKGQTRNLYSNYIKQLNIANEEAIHTLAGKSYWTPNSINEKSKQTSVN